jgi:chitodextrinase
MFARNFWGLLLIMAVSICLFSSSSISSATAISSVAEWAAGTQYNVGDVVSYQSNIYTCRQEHTALANWAPPNVPALWGQLTSQQPVGIPAVPEDLAGTAVSSSVINVSWQASSGATGYDLEIDGVTKSNVTSPYSHTGLSANSTHKYKIRANNAAGTSAWSSLISVSTSASDNNGGKT